MGLIVDTSIFIAGERRGRDLAAILDDVEFAFPILDAAISTITVVEIDHGLYRAKTEEQRQRRHTLSNDITRDVIVQPVSLEIAHLAGRIEGEQAAIGNVIALADLLIGATALHLGLSVLTLNTRHFQRIPNLPVLTL